MLNLCLAGFIFVSSVLFGFDWLVIVTLPRIKEAKKNKKGRREGKKIAD